MMCHHDDLCSNTLKSKIGLGKLEVSIFLSFKLKIIADADLFVSFT